MGIGFLILNLPPTVDYVSTEEKYLVENFSKNFQFSKYINQLRWKLS